LKHTQKIDLFRTFKKYRFSFLSVSLIVALGVTAFLGIHFTSLAMNNMGNKFYKETNFADFQMISANGFSSDDIEKFSTVDVVDKAEGIYTTQALVSINEEELVGEFITQTSDINISQIIEGVMPLNNNECAIEKTIANKYNLAVGDNIVLSRENAALSNSTFVVSAIVNPAQVFCKGDVGYRGTSVLGDGIVEMYIILNENAFAFSLQENVYSSVYLTFDKSKNVDLFSDEYKQLSLNVKKNLQSYIEMDSEGDNYTLVLDVYANASFNLFSSDIKALSKIAITCSMLFIIISAIISYTTVERIICENKKNIGMLKSMGMNNKQIFQKYFICSGMAAVFGIIIGGLVSYFFVESFVYKIGYSSAYIINKFTPTFELNATLFIFAGILVCVLLSSYISCRRLMKMSATVLMDSSVAGKSNHILLEKNPFIWKKLSQKMRITLRNVFADKIMLAATLAGIVGCTTILGVVFTVKFSIGDIPKQQYDVIQKYDTVIKMKSYAGKEASLNLSKDILNMKDVEAVKLCTKYTMVNVDGVYNYSSLLITDDVKFNKFFEIKDINTKKLMTVPNEGVLIARKFAEVMNLKVGDNFNFFGDKGESYSVKVSGIFENYIGYIIILSDAYYEKTTNKLSELNTFYLKTGEAGLQSFSERIKGYNSFINIEAADSGRAIFVRKMANVNAVIMLILFLAILLTVIVLQNLFVMNIIHKKNELTVMSIMGYSRRQISMYIVREGFIMLVFGLFVGGIVSAFLGSYISKAIEFENLQNVRGIKIEACLIAIAISAIYTIVVNLLSLRTLRKIKIADIDL